MIEWEGIPKAPDRRGWHWLKRRCDGELSPLLWTDEHEEGTFEWWDEDDHHCPKKIARYWGYYARCDPPLFAENPLAPAETRDTGGEPRFPRQLA
jgi:hypothetical protein